MGLEASCMAAATHWCVESALNSALGYREGARKHYISAVYYHLFSSFLSGCLTGPWIGYFLPLVHFHTAWLPGKGRPPSGPPPPSTQLPLCRSHLALSLLIFELIGYIMSCAGSSIGALPVCVAHRNSVDAGVKSNRIQVFIFLTIFVLDLNLHIGVRCRIPAYNDLLSPCTGSICNDEAPLSMSPFACFYCSYCLLMDTAGSRRLCDIMNSASWT